MFSAFDNIKVEIFGSSHAPEIGVRLNGIPKGEKIDEEEIKAFLETRKAGKNAWSTPRKEPDEPIIISGIENGTTTGEEIKVIIKNLLQKSSDYCEYATKPRPSHADYVAIIKDGEKAEIAGGGRFSGRLTAPMCIAGSIALQILKRKGIEIGAYVAEIGGVKGKSYGTEVALEEIKEMEKRGEFALTNNEEMVRKATEAREDGDSVGGTVECIVYGMPVGVGDALYGGTEGRIASSVFAVPAVKAVEFGLGTGFADKKGSEANDAFCFRNGKVCTETNNNGGINGGITNGMPVTVRATLKPTPSIAKKQKTVDLEKKEETTIEIKGRHDACIVPRAVPAVKSAVALTILDMILN